MMLVSFLRGALVAAVIAVALALPRSIDIATSAWITLLAVTHLALPFAAAFWGRREDTLSLDVGLAGIGVAYLAMLAFKSDASAQLYLAIPVAYALYAFVATMIFHGLGKWRSALRVRGFRQLRAAAQLQISSGLPPRQQRPGRQH